MVVYANPPLNKVSIPYRGSGKGDCTRFCILTFWLLVSIPSRGSGKGDFLQYLLKQNESTKVSIPSRGSGKGD